MAVTILKRPQGHILSSTLEDALVTDDYGNAGALFDNPNHGLVDGDYVYVTSDIENYNGFWQVEQINSRFFWLREYPTSTLLQWVVDGVIHYYKATSTHEWSCVHLPIIYNLSNNRWPTNSIDPTRTISSVVDNLGFCQLTLSGSLGALQKLMYVKVSTGALAGIYQIIDAINVVINVNYTAANDTALTGATIQLYYNNYNVRVRVFAGLSASHFWNLQKPYEQIVDLKLIPDDDGLVEVNINEFLKSKLNPLSNNTQLATLPNDIDSFCEFYISTAETYDTTDGEVVTTSTPSFTADSGNFEGVAVNAMLQFKNRYAGYLSEYLPGTSDSKFLTLFDQPRLFAGCYFDISFLVDSTNVLLKLDWYDQYDNLILSSIETLPDQGLGVYRKAITEVVGASRLETKIYTEIIVASDWFDSTDWDVWSGFALAGSAAGWIEPIGVGAGVDSGSLGINLTAGEYTNYYRNDVEVSFVAGVTYSLSLTYRERKTSSTQLMKVDIVFMDEIGTVLGTGTTGFYSIASDAVVTKDISVTPSADGTRIGIVAYADAGNSGRVHCSLRNLVSTSIDLSETKTINIDSECSFQDIYLTWKNYLGGMDYWKFTAQKDYIADIESTTETTENIFPTWPKSYGEFADTIDRETSRTSRDKIVVRSQNVTEDEMNAIRYIVSSPLVQIMVSKNDRRTVKVSTGSFTWKRDEDKLYAIEFEISYTNTIPSQSL